MFYLIVVPPSYLSFGASATAYLLGDSIENPFNLMLDSIRNVYAWAQVFDHLHIYGRWMRARGARSREWKWIFMQLHCWRRCIAGYCYHFILNLKSKDLRDCIKWKWKLHLQFDIMVCLCFDITVFFLVCFLRWHGIAKRHAAKIFALANIWLQEKEKKKYSFRWKMQNQQKSHQHTLSHTQSVIHKVNEWIVTLFLKCMDCLLLFSLLCVFFRHFLFYVCGSVIVVVRFVWYVIAITSEKQEKKTHTCNKYRKKVQPKNYIHTLTSTCKRLFE